MYKYLKYVWRVTVSMKSNEEMGASPSRYRHPGIELPASWQNHDGEKPASRRDLLPSRLQRMLQFCQIRLSLSIPTHMQAMWSKYGECLLPIHGEIRPRSCLPGNASAILGCPNLEIPASDDQRCHRPLLNKSCPALDDDDTPLQKAGRQRCTALHRVAGRDLTLLLTESCIKYSKCIKFVVGMLFLFFGMSYYFWW